MLVKLLGPDSYLALCLISCFNKLRVGSGRIPFEILSTPRPEVSTGCLLFVRCGAEGECGGAVGRFQKEIYVEKDFCECKYVR